MHTTPLHRYCQSRIVYFLFLIAFALVQMSPLYVLLPLPLLAAIACVTLDLPLGTGYLAVALTVCKNE